MTDDVAAPTVDPTGEVFETTDAAAEADEVSESSVAVLETTDEVAADTVADTTEEPAPKASRAGRNLPAAIGVGVGLLALLGLALAFRPEPFVALVVVAVCLGLVEFTQALRHVGVELPLPVLLVGGFILPLATYFAGANGLLFAFVIMVGILAAWQALNAENIGIPLRARTLTSSIFALTYVSFLASFVVLLLSQYRGNWRVALMVLLAVANDTGGYIAGVLFGKHPMAPTVSPKKSWEGFIGSIILTSLVGIFGSMLVMQVPFLPQAGMGFFSAALPLGILLGIACAIAATIGDLSESLIKRDIGIKDMGNLLPGHGGALDRLDSILIVAPTVFMILSLVGTYG